MMFLVSLLVSRIVGLSIAASAGKLAHDAVTQFNLRQISKVLDMNYISEGVYPSSINQLIVNREIQNLPLHNDYFLQVSSDCKKASVLGESTDKIYCWKSDTEQIATVNDRNSCYP